MARLDVPVKTLKNMLKSKGLKTTGKKSTLTRRAKKAHLMRGGEEGVLNFKVKVTLTDKGKDNKQMAASFVHKHSKEIIDWIVEQNDGKRVRAIQLTRAKGDEINVKHRHDPKLAEADVKKEALKYFVDGKITINDKPYDIKIVEAKR